jgi:very-short-patch-repair endonuclease
MDSSAFNFQIHTDSISSPIRLSGLPTIPAPSQKRSLGFQYIINSINEVIEILHSPLPDKLSPKTQNPNEAIQSAPEIGKLLEALNIIDWNKDQIDLEKLLEKLERFKHDKFKYYRCIDKLLPNLENLISKNKEFNLSIMNLTLGHLEEFDFPNDQLKIIIDLMNSRLKNSTYIKFDEITQCFKKLKAIDPSLTVELINNLYTLIKNSNETPNPPNCLEILEGLEYNNSPEVEPILQFVLKNLTESNQIDRRIGLVLNFLREKTPELYAGFIRKKSKINYNELTDNYFNNIVSFLSLPSAETNNNVIEVYINKLENFNSDDFSIRNCCRLIKYCRNKNQDHANRILLALDKILKNKQDEITGVEKQIILRELNLLKFVNTDTANLDVIQSLKNKCNVQRLQESPRNKTEKRFEHLLKELEIRILPTRYFDGIEMDFLIMIGTGRDTKKINLEIDGKYHNRFYKLKENELRDKYLTGQGVEVIRLKLPNGSLDNAALKKLICEKLGIN